MTLRAADGQAHLLPARRACRHFESPRAWLGHRRQSVEVRENVAKVLIAHLRLDEGGHDAPRLADRPRELGDRQLAAGEIRANATLAFGAMAIPAARVGAFPQRLAGLGITGLR